MEVKATSRYVRVAPNKARQVIQHIKGLEIDEARRVLAFSPKDVARQILKTLDSAVANAEHNEDLDEDDLYVSGVIVDEGPTLRRFQPRAMGRAYRIRKRTSHITVKVGLREPEFAVAGARPAAAPAAAAPEPEPTGAAQEPTAEAEEPTADAEEPTAQAEEPTADAEEPTAQAEEPTADAETARADDADTDEPDTDETTASDTPDDKPEKE